MSPSTHAIHPLPKIGQYFLLPGQLNNLDFLPPGSPLSRLFSHKKARLSPNDYCHCPLKLSLAQPASQSGPHNHTHPSGVISHHCPPGLYIPLLPNQADSHLQTSPHSLELALDFLLTVSISLSQLKVAILRSKYSLTFSGWVRSSCGPYSTHCAQWYSSHHIASIHSVSPKDSGPSLGVGSGSFFSYSW